MHTGESDLAVSPYTRDADLALSPELLADRPSLADAMEKGGFKRTDQPGVWKNAKGGQVDLLVPEAVAPGRGRRGAGLQTPHGSKSARKVAGLEPALLDNSPISVDALEKSDDRAYTIAVAGPAALLIAKLFKIGERAGDSDRLRNKDALDVFRLLRATETESLGATIKRLLQEPLSQNAAEKGIDFLRELFGTEDAPGVKLLLDAIAWLGDDAVISASCVALADDLVRFVLTGNQPIR
jgi:hypothetical protein